ncbi:MAG: TatD family hydrolase [Woeseia sp.]
MSGEFELIDIGANLAHDAFDSDRDEVIQRAAAYGVRRLVITGSDETSSLAAARLTQEYPGRLWSTAGVHPHHAGEYTEDVAGTLRQLLGTDCVVAVGECGLDYYRDFSPRAAQRTAFQAQLELAQESKLPVFLHQRDAHADFAAILEPMLDGICRGVAHCFTGSRQALQAYLEMGLYIGVTGWICDERRGAELREMAHEIPPDRLMLETDAPYLLPRTLRPKPSSRRNEPMYLLEVLRVFADASGRSPESVAAACTANAERFFGLPALARSGS